MHDVDLPAGYALLALDETESTNDEARRLAEAGEGEGTVVWALRQTRGRGRHGRTWTSPEGNMYLSMLLKPRCPLKQAAQLSFVAAVALGDTVSRYLGGGRPITFKWPNDLLIGGRKVAGILLETLGGERDRTEWLIVGVGLNVASFPDDAQLPATSLAAEGSGDTPVGEIAASFVRSFDVWFRQWHAYGFANARKTWIEHAAGLGQTIEVRQMDTVREGVFESLDDEGALHLRGKDATLHVVTAGEIFFPDTN